MPRFIMLLALTDHPNDLVMRQEGDVVDIVPWPEWLDYWDGKPFWESAGRQYLFVPVDEELTGKQISELKKSAWTVIGFKDNGDGELVPVTKLTAKRKTRIPLSSFGLTQEEMNSLVLSPFWYQPLMERWRRSSTKRYKFRVRDVYMKDVKDSTIV